MHDDTGVAWWTIPPGHTIWLLVHHGRVTDATPHARRYFHGATPADLLRTGKTVGAAVIWAPLQHLPEPATHHTGLEPVRRWARTGHPHPAERYVTFGRAGNRWYARHSDDSHLWLTTSPADAWTLARRRMAVDGGWRPTAARYDEHGQPRPDLPLPPELSGA